MKFVVTILASLVLATEASTLGSYSLPSPGISFNHGSSSIDGGSRGSFGLSGHSNSGSFGSSGQGFGVSFGSTDQGFGGSLGFPGQGFGGSFGSSGQGFGGSFGSTGQGFGGSVGSTGQGFGGSFGSSGQGFGGSFASAGQGFGGSFGPSGQGFGGSFSGAASCSGGQVRHVDGRCVTPEVQHRVYVYDVPEQPQTVGPRPHVPLPKVEHNILFVRLPENAGNQDPIVVPPPQQKNVVYVLSKGGADEGQKVINVPAPPKSQPEVYFVDYEEGQNPTLPGGVDLQTALGSAAHQGVGQVIGSRRSTGGISGGAIGSSFPSGGSSFTSGSGSFTTGGGSFTPGRGSLTSEGGSFSSGGGPFSGGLLSSGRSSVGGNFASGGGVSQPSGLYTTP